MEAKKKAVSAHRINCGGGIGGAFATVMIFILIGLAVFMSSSLAISHKDISGEIEDMKYSYRTFMLSCTITLTNPDGSVLIVHDEDGIVHDEDGDDIIGNNKNDWYQIKKGNASITYTPTDIRLKDWKGEILDRKEALNQATTILREWSDRIVPK